MENQDWVSYKIEVRNRLKRFALDILKLSEMIPGTTGGKVINYHSESLELLKILSTMRKKAST